MLNLMKSRNLKFIQKIVLDVNNQFKKIVSNISVHCLLLPASKGQQPNLQALLNMKCFLLPLNVERGKNFQRGIWTIETFTLLNTEVVK